MSTAWRVTLPSRLTAGVGPAAMVLGSLTLPHSSARGVLNDTTPRPKTVITSE